jgi:hypothetical protein
MALDGRTLYLLIGEGDVMAGVPPNYGINLNGPSSPIFSSILKIQFSREPDEIQAAFRLTSVSHWALLDGWDERFENGAGDGVTIQLLTAFRPLVRNVLGGGERVRPSDPISVVFSPDKRYLYVSDASSETVSRVDTSTGRWLTLVRLEPYPRQTPAGTVLVDNVPTGLCWSGGKLALGLLSAGPFPLEEASIRTVDPATGATDVLARGLTAVTDIACSGASRVIAAEFTLDLTVLAPSGRIKVIEGGAARVVGLISQVSRSIPVRVRFTPLAWKARSSGSPRRRHLGIAFAGDWSERVVERRTQPPRARSEENTIFKSVDLGWKTWRLPALSMSGLSGRSWANWCSSALLRNSRSPAGCVQRFGHFRHCSARVRDLGTANKAFRTAFLGARDYFWRRLRSTTALNRRDEGGGGASGLRRTTASGGRVPS